MSETTDDASVEAVDYESTDTRAQYSVRVMIPEDDELTTRFLQTQPARGRSRALRMLMHMYVLDHGDRDVLSVYGDYAARHMGSSVARGEQLNIDFDESIDSNKLINNSVVSRENNDTERADNKVVNSVENDTDDTLVLDDDDVGAMDINAILSSRRESRR